MRLVLGNDNATEVHTRSSKEPLNFSDNVDLVDQTTGDDDDDFQFSINSTHSRSKKRKKTSQAEVKFLDPKYFGKDSLTTTYFDNLDKKIEINL
jgi:hypothetical protein